MTRRKLFRVIVQGIIVLGEISWRAVIQGGLVRANCPGGKSPGVIVLGDFHRGKLSREEMSGYHFLYVKIFSLVCSVFKYVNKMLSAVNLENDKGSRKLKKYKLIMSCVICFMLQLLSTCLTQNIYMKPVDSSNQNCNQVD